MSSHIFHNRAVIRIVKGESRNAPKTPLDVKILLFQLLTSNSIQNASLATEPFELMLKMSKCSTNNRFPDPEKPYPGIY